MLLANRPEASAKATERRATMKAQIAADSWGMPSRCVPKTILISALLLVSLMLPIPSRGQLVLNREDVLTLPKDYQKGSLIFSEDGTKYAFVIENSEGQRVVENGVPQESYAQCVRLRFSPRTNRLFYWALDQSGGKRQVVLVADAKVIPTSFASNGSLFFSANGARWAAVGGEQGKQEGDKILVGEVVVFADGQEVGRYRDASWPSFSLDGKHLAFLSKDDTSRISLIVDGQKRTTYAAPAVKCSYAMTASVIGPNLPPLFSVEYMSDGTLLILTQDQNGWTLYRDDKPVSSYLQNVWGGGSLQVMVFEEFKTAASILASSIATAESTPVAAWWERMAGEKEQWRVVRDGRPVDKIVCPGFWSDDSPSVSANGKRCGYTAFQKSAEGNDDIFVVVDGTKFGPYKNTWGFKFSRDGKRFAYAASDGSKESPWRYYADGKALAPTYGSVYPPVFSDGGTHLAWRAERGSKPVLALDGNEAAVGEEALWGPMFNKAGRVGWMVKDGDKVIRCSATYTLPGRAAAALELSRSPLGSNLAMWLAAAVVLIMGAALFGRALRTKPVRA
jgi:hypothetical protein